MTILYKIASRGRPEQLFRTIDNIISMASLSDYLILVTLDVDDTTVANREVNDRLKSYGSKVRAYYGFSGSKVAAINKDLEYFHDFKILVNVSDDQVFIEKWFDLDILSQFQLFDGLVHFLDRHNPSTCTMSMVSRKYFLEDRFIYHPAFTSLYCDNFQQELAKKRNAYKFASKQIFNHLHWRWGLSEKDESYQKNESEQMYAKDRAVRDQLRKEYNLI